MNLLLKGYSRAIAGHARAVAQAHRCRVDGPKFGISGWHMIVKEWAEVARERRKQLERSMEADRRAEEITEGRTVSQHHRTNFKE